MTIERSVARLEQDVGEIKAVLARLAPKIDEMFGVITAILPTLATKAELAELRAEFKAELADKPSKSYLWAVVGTMVAAILGAVAVGVTIAR